MRYQVQSSDTERSHAIRMFMGARHVSARLTRGDTGQWSLHMGGDGAADVWRDLSASGRKQNWPAALRMALAVCEQYLMRRSRP
jgi:hypothetical protein